MSTTTATTTPQPPPQSQPPPVALLPLAPPGQTCPHCHQRECFRVRWQTIADGRHQARLDCAVCERFIQYLPQKAQKARQSPMPVPVSVPVASPASLADLHRQCATMTTKHGTLLAEYERMLDSDAQNSEVHKITRQISRIEERLIGFWYAIADAQAQINEQRVADADRDNSA